MIVPMIGFGQNKYTWKEIKEKNGSVTLLKSTKEPITGIVEGKQRLGEIFSHKAIYEEGQKISCRGYYKTGEIHHKHDKNNYLTLYYKDGNIEQEGNRDLMGNSNGPIKHYYENGQLQLEEIYKDGKLNGPTKFYYEYLNGQLQEERNYQDGKLNGMLKTYYENSQLKTQGKLIPKNQKYSRQDGIWEEYYENGQLKTQGKYQDGKKDGLWKKWHENGEIKKEKHY